MARPDFEGFSFSTLRWLLGLAALGMLIVVAGFWAVSEWRGDDAAGGRDALFRAAAWLAAGLVLLFLLVSALRNILHRYIFMELVKVMILSTMALTFFLAIAYALSELGKRGLGPIDSVQLVLYFVPVMLVFAMPIAALLTTTLVYGRLSSENEITACRASGVSMSTVLWPTVVLGILIGIGNFVLFDTVIPWSRSSAEEVGMRNIERIFFHRLRTQKHYGRRGDFYIQADEVEGNMLYGVVTQYGPPGPGQWEGTAPAAYLRFLPPEPGDGQIAPPPPPPSDGSPAPRPTREQIAADSRCWDARVIPRGRVMVQLFGVYGSDVARTKGLLGNPPFVRVLRDVRVLRPNEMTLTQLYRRYRDAENTFDYREAVSRGAGEKALGELRGQIRAASLAEIHSRYASMFSCVLLVGLGAVLGMAFRHGHFLTAFAVSLGPALFAIFAILLGAQMVRKLPELMQGLTWVIWSGNIVVAILDVVLIGRLLRH